jgi:hypothetical protein
MEGGNMRVKYIELDTNKSQKIFSKLLKQGYKSDNIFTDKTSAESHIQNLYNEGKDVVVVVETRVIKYQVFSRNSQPTTGGY